MKFNKSRVIKYIVVLTIAIISRILFAVYGSMAIQKYAGLIIIILAIAAFFTWDYIDRKKHKDKR